MTLSEKGLGGNKTGGRKTANRVEGLNSGLSSRNRGKRMDRKHRTWKYRTVPVVLAGSVGWTVMVIPAGRNAEGSDVRQMHPTGAR